MARKRIKAKKAVESRRNTVRLSKEFDKNAKPQPTRDKRKDKNISRTKKKKPNTKAHSGINTERVHQGPKEAKPHSPLQRNKLEPKLEDVRRELGIDHVKLKSYLTGEDFRAKIGEDFRANIKMYDVLTGKEIYFIFDKFKIEESKKRRFKDIFIFTPYAPIGPGSGYTIELSRDSFKDIRNNISCGKLPEFDSHFDDSQAQKICAKMSSSFARSTANKWLITKDKNEKELLRYKLHFMAEKALKVFGGKILTLIFNLPVLKFGQSTAIEVKTYQNIRPDFPRINFIVNQSIFNVAFFTKQDPKNNNLLRSDVRIYHRLPHNIYEPIASMTKEGYIQLKLDKFRPQLSLFLDLDGIKDGKYIMYSGVQTGKCGICNQPLTDPESLRIGIGPVCAKNLNLS